jgi:NADH-quinone oxidoreductase subunit K
MLVNCFLLIFIIFFLGILGVTINRHNIIIVLLSFELIYLSSNLIFAFTSFFTGDLLGLFYVLYSITIVGAEACIGLAVILLYYSINSQLSLNTLNLTKL